MGKLIAKTHVEKDFSVIVRDDVKVDFSVKATYKDILTAKEKAMGMSVKVDTKQKKQSTEVEIPFNIESGGLYLLMFCTESEEIDFLRADFEGKSKAVNELGIWLMDVISEQSGATFEAEDKKKAN